MVASKAKNRHPQTNIENVLKKTCNIFSNETNIGYGGVFKVVPDAPHCARRYKKAGGSPGY